MKLLTINVILAITMLFNAFGFNGQAKPGEIQTTQIDSNTAGSEPLQGYPSPLQAGDAPEPSPSSASNSDANVSSIAKDFQVRLEHAYLTKTHETKLKYQIDPKFAANNPGRMQLSIKILGDRPIELNRVAVQNLEGEVKIRIDQGCEDGCTIGVDLLTAEGRILADDKAVISLAEVFSVSRNGGEIKTRDGKISVKIGANAFATDANIYIQENTLTENVAGGTVSHPFVIDAEAASDSQEINTFAEPVQLIYSYDKNEFLDPGRWTFVSY